MANWCGVTIKIHCKNDESATKIAEDLKQWLYKPINGVCSNWAGALLLNSGMMKTHEEIQTSYLYAAEVDSIEADTNMVKISLKSKYEPMVKIILDVVHHYFYEEVEKIYYVATEPCAGVYYTNDPQIVGKYYLETDDLEAQMYDNAEDVCQALLDNLKEQGIESTSESLEELIDEYNYFEDFYFITCTQYEFVDIDELN